MRLAELAVPYMGHTQIPKKRVYLTIYGPSNAPLVHDFGRPCEVHAVRLLSTQFQYDGIPACYGCLTFNLDNAPWVNESQGVLSVLGSTSRYTWKCNFQAPVNAIGSFEYLWADTECDTTARFRNPWFCNTLGLTAAFVDVNGTGITLPSITDSWLCITVEVLLTER